MNEMDRKREINWREKGTDLVGAINFVRLARNGLATETSKFVSVGSKNRLGHLALKIHNINFI